MAKIRLESLIQSLPKKGQENPRGLQGNTQINQIGAAATDSIVNKTRPKLTADEASRLGDELAQSFNSNPEALEAQGSGLTKERVRALLSDD